MKRKERREYTAYLRSRGIDPVLWKKAMKIARDHGGRITRYQVITIYNLLKRGKTVAWIKKIYKPGAKPQLSRKTSKSKVNRKTSRRKKTTSRRKVKRRVSRR